MCTQKHLYYIIINIVTQINQYNKTNQSSKIVAENHFVSEEEEESELLGKCLKPALPGSRYAVGARDSWCRPSW